MMPPREPRIERPIAMPSRRTGEVYSLQFTVDSLVHSSGVHSSGSQFGSSEFWFTVQAVHSLGFTAGSELAVDRTVNSVNCPPDCELSTVNCELSRALVHLPATSLARDVPPSRAHAVALARFDADGVPAAVLRPRGGVTQVVLLAQLVGDAGDGGIEIAHPADDLGTAAAVVGDVAQRGDVDAIVAGAAGSRASAPRNGTGRRLRHGRRRGRAPARHGKGHRDRARRLAGRPALRPPVDDVLRCGGI